MQKGQSIEHAIYGQGTVITSDEDRTAIDFDSHGRKLFVTGIMQAELIGSAPGGSEPGRADEDRGASRMPPEVIALLGSRGERVRESRKARGLTQRELSRLAKMSKSHLEYIEHGGRVPSVSMLQKIYRALLESGAEARCRGRKISEASTPKKRDLTSKKRDHYFKKA